MIFDLPQLPNLEGLHLTLSLDETNDLKGLLTFIDANKPTVPEYKQWVVDNIPTGARKEKMNEYLPKSKLLEVSIEPPAIPLDTIPDASAPSAPSSNIPTQAFPDSSLAPQGSASLPAISLTDNPPDPSPNALANPSAQGTTPPVVGTKRLKLSERGLIVLKQIERIDTRLDREQAYIDKL